MLHASRLGCVDEQLALNEFLLLVEHARIPVYSLVNGSDAELLKFDDAQLVFAKMP